MSSSVERTYAVLPQPSSITAGEGDFLLTSDTAIVADSQTQELAMLLAGILAPATGFTLQVSTGAPAEKSSIVLGIDAGLARLSREGYVLTVTPQRITIQGAATAGVFYGIQTLRQLLPVEIFSATVVSREWSVPAVTIEDSPRFPWRGYMIDTGRHFVPKAEILKLVDLLALHKVNTLHLHLTDDQGWRIEIKRYPKLTEIGGYRKETVVGHGHKPEGYDGTPHGGFYTQDDLREIVAYAAARSITVVPEIDMPGHAQAAVAAYPEVGVTGDPAEVGTTWGIHPYLFKPDDATLQFLYNILDEVVAIFPSLYIHVGGDEAIKNQWQASQEVQARIKELGLQDEHELQSWFITQMGNHLAKHGRLLVGWDEILEGGIPNGATVISWRGIQGGIAAAQADHDVIMAPYTDLYLDYYQSNDPAEKLAIGGYLPINKVYAYNPIPVELTEEQAKHVLGAQCQLWTEYVPNPEHVEYMTFPRLVALSEITWTPLEQHDFASFRERLAQHEARLTLLNVVFRPIATLDQEGEFPARKKLW